MVMIGLETRKRSDLRVLNLRIVRTGFLVRISVYVVPVSIERRSTWVSVFSIIIDNVEPVWLGGQLVVKNSWVPFRGGREYDVWKFIKLLLCVGYL